MRMHENAVAVAFCYSGRVAPRRTTVRKDREAGVERRFESPEADVEMIAMASAFKALAPPPPSISVRSSFSRVMAQLELPDNDLRLQSLIARKEMTALIRLLDTFELPVNVREEVLACPPHGRKFSKGRGTDNERSCRALANLRQKRFSTHGLEERGL
jgi:hypothetical protein